MKINYKRYMWKAHLIGKGTPEDGYETYETAHLGIVRKYDRMKNDEARCYFFLDQPLRLFVGWESCRNDALKAMELDGIYVPEAERRQGVGSKLLRAAIKQAKKARPGRTIYACCDLYQHPERLDFLRKNGFKVYHWNPNKWSAVMRYER